MVGVYTAKKKEATISLVLAGSPVVAVAEASGIHERTIRKWLAAAKEGRALTAARPGPKPFLPQDAEERLYDWTVGRQLVGRPVGRSDIIRKAQEVALLCSGQSVGEGWYKRFKEQFPSLTGRSAQCFHPTGSVPSSIRRPLVLILDGCGSHYSPEVVDAADELSILLVFLPPNGSHLLQPLDVAVFATLKSKIHNMISELVDEDDNGYYNISKDDAIKVASLAWGGAKVGRNLERGFKTRGLFPLSLVKMQARLDTFARSGAPRHVQLAAWLQLKSIVKDEILKLPAPPSKKLAKKRKRISVGGRLLTH